MCTSRPAKCGYKQCLPIIITARQRSSTAACNREAEPLPYKGTDCTSPSAWVISGSSRRNRESTYTRTCRGTLVGRQDDQQGSLFGPCPSLTYNFAPRVPINQYTGFPLFTFGLLSLCRWSFERSPLVRSSHCYSLASTPS